MSTASTRTVLIIILALVVIGSLGFGIVKTILKPQAKLAECETISHNLRQTIFAPTAKHTPTAVPTHTTTPTSTVIAVCRIDWPLDIGQAVVGKDIELTYVPVHPPRFRPDSVSWTLDGKYQPQLSEAQDVRLRAYWKPRVSGWHEIFASGTQGSLAASSSLRVFVVDETQPTEPEPAPDTELCIRAFGDINDNGELDEAENSLPWFSGEISRRAGGLVTFRQERDPFYQAATMGVWCVPLKASDYNIKLDAPGMYVPTRSIRKGVDSQAVDIPAVTCTPTATPSPTPTPSPTYTLMPTQTPLPTPAPPRILSPAEGSHVNQKEPVFKWEVSQSLGPDDSFRLRCCKEGSGCETGYYPLGDLVHETSHSWWPTEGNGYYIWSVNVERDGKPVSPCSSARFRYTQPKSNKRDKIPTPAW